MSGIIQGMIRLRNAGNLETLELESVVIEEENFLFS